MRFSRRKKETKAKTSSSSGKKPPPPIVRQKPSVAPLESDLDAEALSRQDLILSGGRSKRRGKLATTPATESSSKAPASDVSEIKYGDKTLRLDIGATIRERALKVRPSDLASKHSEVQVLGMGAIMRLVEDAVDDALQLVEHDWGEAERRKLLEEAEETFRERLQAEKADLEARAKSLQDQLYRAQSVLEEERKKVVTADQFTVSDAGIVELEKRLSRLIDRSLQKGGVTKELEQEMRDTFARLLDDEREKISEREREAQNASISLLERKIQRLSQSLEDTDGARKRAERRAHALETAQGNFIAGNIYDIGLDEDDPQKEQKLLLLKEIAESNRDVRDFMEKTGVLPAMHERSASGDSPQGGDEARNAPEPDAPGGDDDGTGEDAGAAREESYEDDESIVSAEVAVSDSDGIKKITLKKVRPPPIEKVERASTSDGEKHVDKVPVLVSPDRASPDVDPDDCLWEPSD